MYFIVLQEVRAAVAVVFIADALQDFGCPCLDHVKDYDIGYIIFEQLETYLEAAANKNTLDNQFRNI